MFRTHQRPNDGSTSTAYQLSNLIAAMAETDDPEEVAIFEEMVADLGEAFKDYVVQCLDLAADLRMSCDAIDIEIKRLQALKAQRESRAERLTNAPKRYMENMGYTEVLTDLYTVKLRKNPPKVIVDEALLDRSYFVEKISYQPNKKQIADALKNGVPVDGAYLQQTTSLTIK